MVGIYTGDSRCQSDGILFSRNEHRVDLINMSQGERYEQEENGFTNTLQQTAGKEVAVFYDNKNFKNHKQATFPCFYPWLFIC